MRCDEEIGRKCNYTSVTLLSLCPSINRSMNQSDMFDSIATFLFGAEVTPEQHIKEAQKIADDAVRDLKRQRMSTNHEHTRAIKSLRKKAAMGNTVSQKELTRLAVQCRRLDNRLQKLDTTIEKMATFRQTTSEMLSNEAQLRAFVKMTHAMKMINTNTSAFKLCALMKQYEEQQFLMEQKQEFIDEKFGEMNEEDSEDEAEMANGILQEVMDELNIKLTGDLPDMVRQQPIPTTIATTTTPTTESKQEMVEIGGDDDLLMSRINNLTK